jgi:hypothetical protein
MSNEFEIEQLKALMMSAPESSVTRVIAIALSVALAAVVLWLVRTRRLREEFTPMWVAASLGLALLSLRFEILQAITRAIGAWSPSATLFFLSLVFLSTLCLNYAVRLSRAGVQLKSLAQEVALMQRELEDVRRQDVLRAPPRP